MKMNDLRPEEYVGEEVIVTGTYGDKWQGKAVAYSDKPSVLIEYENGLRMMLPAKNMRLANPPKPWHDAKPGEVWLLTLEDKEVAAIYGGEQHWTRGDGQIVYRPGTRITDARRIWPEDSNDS